MIAGREPIFGVSAQGVLQCRYCCTVCYGIMLSHGGNTDVVPVSGIRRFDFCCLFERGESLRWPPFPVQRYTTAV
jgi:hypothetical protein